MPHDFIISLDFFFFHAKVEPCEPIEKVLWRVDRSNYVDYFVFSGGLSVDVTGVPPSITFMRGKLKFFLHTYLVKVHLSYCELEIEGTSLKYFEI